jgi:hypothetical protein
MSYIADIEVGGKIVSDSTHRFATKQEAEAQGAMLHDVNPEADGYFATEIAGLPVNCIYDSDVGMAVEIDHLMVEWIDVQIDLLTEEMDTLAQCKLYGQAHEVQMKLSELRDASVRAKSIQDIDRT